MSKIVLLQRQRPTGMKVTEFGNENFLKHIRVRDANNRSVTNKVSVDSAELLRPFGQTSSGMFLVGEQVDGIAEKEARLRSWYTHVIEDPIIPLQLQDIDR